MREHNLKVTTHIVVGVPSTTLVINITSWVGAPAPTQVNNIFTTSYYCNSLLWGAPAPPQQVFIILTLTIVGGAQAPPTVIMKSHTQNDIVVQQQY